MKAALLHSPERILIEEMAAPRPANGEVMIRPEYAGICGTDISFYMGHRVVHIRSSWGMKSSGGLPPSARE